MLLLLSLFFSMEKSKEILEKNLLDFLGKFYKKN